MMVVDVLLYAFILSWSSVDSVKSFIFFDLLYDRESEYYSLKFIHEMGLDNNDNNLALNETNDLLVSPNLVQNRPTIKMRRPNMNK